MTRAEIADLLALAEKATGLRKPLYSGKFRAACSPVAIADLCRSLIAAEQQLADQKVIDDQDDAEWSILKERADSAEAREAVLREAFLVLMKTVRENWRREGWSPEPNSGQAPTDELHAMTRARKALWATDSLDCSCPDDDKETCPVHADERKRCPECGHAYDAARHLGEVADRLASTGSEAADVLKAAAAIDEYPAFDPRGGVPAGFWRDVNLLRDAYSAYRAAHKERT